MLITRMSSILFQGRAVEVRQQHYIVHPEMFYRVLWTQKFTSRVTVYFFFFLSFPVTPANEAKEE